MTRGEMQDRAKALAKPGQRWKARVFGVMDTITIASESTILTSRGTTLPMSLVELVEWGIEK